ncbi:MAG: hypothetical protein LBB65_02615, partial [Burkholderiales bacterium]|nr:hypothetical protein [Burkholderiales bacterium]
LSYYHYDAQANVLLPASIAYTTGLINYFFHGKMEISLPAMGIYSIVDHGAFVPPPGTDAKNGFRGFDKIKLTLKNTTDPVNAPDGSHPQTMSNGYLVAVLKFHRNLAYTDDLDGELGMDDPASVFFDNYSWNEEIVASDPVRLTSLANGESAEFAFTFPTDGQMPINAVSTVRLSVVFKGILGSEQDAVVVAEKPISPPIYFSVYNASDYLRLGNTCYQNTDILANDALWAQLNARCKVGHALDSTCQASPMSGTLSFGPPGNQVLLTWDNSIPERRFARIAFLGDNDPSVLKGTATFTGGNTQIWNKTFDGNAGTMFWYRQIRGVKYNGANVQYLSGDASTSMGICNNFLNGDSDSALPIPAPLEGSERYPVPATSITGW